MLDENLGGGVSLQKNIAELPESLRPRILEARRSLERDVLLTPVWAPGARNRCKRMAVLDAFDGSFFKGRHFARQPEAMIDVGNDREFGFLHAPELDVLESTFATLIKADLPARSRQQVLQLASFFRLPARTQKSSIQTVFLRLLLDPDPGVRTRQEPSFLMRWTRVVVWKCPSHSRCFDRPLRTGPRLSEMPPCG